MTFRATSISRYDKQIDTVAEQFRGGKGDEGDGRYERVGGHKRNKRESAE